VCSILILLCVPVALREQDELIALLGDALKEG